jgi:hypothetical protein
VSARGHLGDGVANVLSTMSGPSPRRGWDNRRTCSWSRRSRFSGVGRSRRRTTGRWIGHRNGIGSRESGGRGGGRRYTAGQGLERPTVLNVCRYRAAKPGWRRALSI